MKVKLTTLIYWLFLAFILTLPLNSLFDTIAFFKGTVGDKTFAQTPIALKIFKDILLLSMTVLCLHSLLRSLNKRLLGFVLFFLVAVAFAAIALPKGYAIAVILGLRSYWVLIFIFAGFYFHEFDPARLYPALRFVFFVELITQVCQLLFAPDYYGYVAYGLSLTNPGTFLIPSTMASYAIMVHYYARETGRRWIYPFTLFSIFLSRSSTAWAVTAVYYIFRHTRRARLSLGITAAVLAVAGIIVGTNLDAFTGRPQIAQNLFTRLDIFVAHLQYPFGKGFGLGSGGSVLLHVDNATIADSTINSLLINFGWIGLPIYVFLIWQAYRYFAVDNFLFLAFVGFSFTMIIFEMTPFIQLFFFELGRRIAEKRKVELYENLAV